MIYQAKTEADEQGSDGEPEPFVLEELTINYAERRVTLARRTLRLIAMEYRLLREFSNNAGRVLTYEHLLERVWDERSSGDVRPMRTIVSKLHRKAGGGRGQPHLHLHRATGRIPDGQALNPAAGRGRLDDPLLVR